MANVSLHWPPGIRRNFPVAALATVVYTGCMARTAPAIGASCLERFVSLVITIDHWFMSTPEKRRKWIEALHEKARGNSELTKKTREILKELDGRLDKSSVLKVMRTILDMDPIENNGIYRFGRWEVSFHENDTLNCISVGSDGAVTVRPDVSNVGDT